MQAMAPLNKRIETDRKFAVACIRLGIIDADTIRRLVTRLKSQGYRESLVDLLEREGHITRAQRVVITQQQEGREEPINIDGFRVHERLGQERGCVVYRATANLAQSEVLLKILPEAFVRDPDLTRRFRDRWEEAKRFSDALVLPMGDFGQTREVVYYTQSFIRGVTLEDFISKRGPFPDFAAINLIGRVAQVIGRGHAQKLIHRDLHPGSVLFLENRQYRLKDFGLIRAINELRNVEDSEAIRRYRSFEDLTGNPPSPSDDLFALGALMFFVLTGHPPFPDTKAFRSEAPDPRSYVADLKPEIADLVQSLLRPGPQGFQSVEELVRQLTQLTGRKPKRSSGKSRSMTSSGGAFDSGRFPIPDASGDYFMSDPSAETVRDLRFSSAGQGFDPRGSGVAPPPPPMPPIPPTPGGAGFDPGAHTHAFGAGTPGFSFDPSGDTLDGDDAPPPYGLSQPGGLPGDSGRIQATPAKVDPFSVTMTDDESAPPRIDPHSVTMADGDSINNPDFDPYGVTMTDGTLSNPDDHATVDIDPGNPTTSSYSSYPVSSGPTAPGLNPFGPAALPGAFDPGGQTLGAPEKDGGTNPALNDGKITVDIDGDDDMGMPLLLNSARETQIEDMSGAQTADFELHERLRVDGYWGIYRGSFGPEKKEAVIKVLQDRALDPTDFERLRQQLQTLTRVTNSSLARIDQVGSMPTGELVVVLEACQGQRLSQATAFGEPMSFARGYDLFLGLLAAVRELHHVQFMHGRITAENVVLGSKDGVDSLKISDPSLAQHTGQEQRLSDASQAQPGQAELMYLPPERLSEQAPDPRSDLFSLGVIAYKLFTGREPFSQPPRLLGVGMIKLAEVQGFDKLAPGWSGPSGLEDFCRKAVAETPGQRFQDIAEMTKAFKKVKSAPPTKQAPAPRNRSTARHTSKGSRDYKKKPERKGLKIALFVGLVVIVLALILAIILAIFLP